MCLHLFTWKPQWHFPNCFKSVLRHSFVFYQVLTGFSFALLSHFSKSIYTRENNQIKSHLLCYYLSSGHSYKKKIPSHLQWQVCFICFDLYISFSSCLWLFPLYLSISFSISEVFDTWFPWFPDQLLQSVALV